MSSPASASSSPKLAPTHPRGLAAVAFILLVIAATIAYLVSGLFGLLILALTPVSGAEGFVVIIKGALACGWSGIGAWLAWDAWHFSWRFTAAPVAAWVLMVGGASMLQGRAFLNIGY